MSLARSTFSTSSTVMRSFVRAPRTATALTSARFSVLQQQHRTYATQDYGSGTGDPRGENPLEQGANPSSHKEHPGPPPPSTGRGSGSTPTKGSTSSKGGHNTSEAAQNGGSSSSKKSSPKTKSTTKSSTKGAQPKILDEEPPAPEKQSAETKKHNREMEGRADRAHAQVGAK